MMGVALRGVSMRPTVAVYCAQYGYTRAELAAIQPACRRWSAEMRTRAWGRREYRRRVAEHTLRVLHEKTIAFNRCFSDAAAELLASSETIDTLLRAISVLPRVSPMTVLGLPVVTDPTIPVGEVRLLSAGQARERRARESFLGIDDYTQKRLMTT